MGINLSDVVVTEPRTLEDFSSKILAIDAFNTIYQFLAIIRQPDGTPLMDHQGRVTSHLSGLIYRLSNFVAVGIRPVFVFDGEPPRLKARTLADRGEVKRRAEREWKEAVEIGDLATARTKARRAPWPAPGPHTRPHRRTMTPCSSVPRASSRISQSPDAESFHVRTHMSTSSPRNSPLKRPSRTLASRGSSSSTWPC